MRVQEDGGLYRLEFGQKLRVGHPECSDLPALLWGQFGGSQQLGVLLMEELCAEVIGGEVEGIGLDLVSGELQFLIDEGLNRVEPVAVVPDVEVLLVLHQ